MLSTGATACSAAVFASPRTSGRGSACAREAAGGARSGRTGVDAGAGRTGADSSAGSGGGPGRCATVDEAAGVVAAAAALAAAAEACGEGPRGAAPDAPTREGLDGGVAITVVIEDDESGSRRADSGSRLTGAGGGWRRASLAFGAAGGFGSTLGARATGVIGRAAMGEFAGEACAFDTDGSSGWRPGAPP